MSFSRIGAGLTYAPRSTRKFWIEGFDFGIDDGPVERLFGSLKIRLRKHGRQLQRVLIVDESVFGDCVRRKADRQIVVEQQQLAQRVAILRDGQAPDETVLRRRAQAGDFQCLRDPLDHPLAVGAGWLRQALRRHAAIADPVCRIASQM